jgi:uncharacterized protein (TIGR03000 family)
MRATRLVIRAAAVGAIMAMSACAQPANAQIMSKWGHPVFTVGSTPYDSTNAGHGNYPGGPGFIPGYGYYPGAGPGTYPWLDGPGTPFDRRAIRPAPPLAFDEEGLHSETAQIIVKIPAEAELWFNETKTTQETSYRVFITPPLTSGQPLRYALRARWRLGTAELRRVEEIDVQPGQVHTVDFLNTEHWEGRRMK